MKIKNFLILCTTSLLLFGCDKNLSNPVTTPTPSITQTDTHTQEQSTQLTYNQYLGLYRNMADSLKLSGYKKIEDNAQQPQLVIIDKSVSFGHRSALTLTGENTDQSTQARVVYKTEDGRKCVYIDFIFLPKDLGNDMVYTNFLPKSNSNDPLFQQYDETILSYKNTLIKITLFFKDNRDATNLYREKYNLEKEVINFLSNN